MSKTLLVTGPPGAGKSTAGEALTEQSVGTWAYIDQDKVRQQIKAGFTDPSNPWTDETQKQWDVSVALCSDMAKRYQEYGINCLIDCFIPPHSLEKWKQTFINVDYEIIVILPTIKVALARNDQRSGGARLRESQVRQHHEWFTEYQHDQRIKIIDSSALAVKDVISALEDILKTLYIKSI